MNRFKKLALAVTAAGLLGGVAAVPAQAAPVVSAVPALPGPGVACSLVGQCASLYNAGTNAVWIDGKIDNVYARTQLLYPKKWSYDTTLMEGFWLGINVCAWTKDDGAPKWQRYWGSKTRYTYVPMQDFDMWNIYTKDCGSST